MAITRRAFIAGSIAALLPGLLSAEATATRAGAIAAFVAALKRNDHAFASEPPFLVFDNDDKLTYISPPGVGGKVEVVPGIREIYFGNILMFHAPYTFADNYWQEGASPPAPRDIAFAVLYNAQSISAVGIEDGHGTLDTMRRTDRRYWNTDPVDPAKTWIKDKETLARNAGFVGDGTWRERVNRALRATYANDCTRWGGMSYTTQVLE